MRSWGLSIQEQEELWGRWRQGESLRLIARRMGKRGPSVRAFVLQSGGVKQPPRRRPARSLSAAEREEISRGVAAGDSCRAIASRLGRAPSTVSRELVRNGGRRGYRAQRADAAADRRAAQPRPCKLVPAPRLRAVVEAKLGLCWSPEQIAGWLPLAYPTDATMPISHETSTSASTSSAAGHCAVSCGVACAPAGRCAIREASAYPRGAASSLPRSRSVGDQPRQTSGRYQDIGRATWCWASVPQRWLPWSSGPVAMAPIALPDGSGGAGPPGTDRGHGSTPQEPVSFVDLGPR